MIESAVAVHINVWVLIIVLNEFINSLPGTDDAGRINRPHLRLRSRSQSKRAPACY
jgi:hypothetical protein